MSRWYDGASDRSVRGTSRAMSYATTTTLRENDKGRRLPANLSVKSGCLAHEFGYVNAPPKDRAFPRELDAELDRIRTFLGL